MTNLNQNSETNNTENPKVKSNDLRHKIDINNNKANAQIKIRLNDECKNGHQDFSVTATIWEIGKTRSDRNMISGGCCHDEILKLRPDLKIFIDLHLCDFNGAPMYTVANGYYHLTIGFNNTKPQDAGFKAKFCEYYRITPEQFEVLKTSESETRFKYNLEKLGIINQWKAEAQKAIKAMEDLTGKEFLNDSKRSQYTPLTEEEIATEEHRQLEGYYTAQNIQARKSEKLAEQIAKIKSDLVKDKDEVIKSALSEYNVKIAILEAGISLNNFIYYKHSNEAVFNWKSYEPKITEAELNTLIEFVKNGNYELPKNIVFKLDAKNN